MAQIRPIALWQIRSLLQIARSNPKCYRENLLNRWQFLVRDDILLPEYLWFVRNEGIWDQPCSDERLKHQEENTKRAATSPLRKSVINAQPSVRRSEDEIERHIKDVNQPVATDSYVWGVIELTGPVDFHLQVCEFLLESDSASVRAFAGQFDESSMNHWEEATRVCVRSVIHHARSHSFCTFCVQQAIASRSYKFLAYLLTKIYDEGKEAVANLEEEYRTLNDGFGLEIDLFDWKTEFEKLLGNWPSGTIGMDDVGKKGWFEE